MKILVTGGAGYVGGHLVDQLALDGHDVHVVDSLLYEDQFLKPGRFSYGDIRDTQLMKKLSVDADCVIWLAALVGDPVCSIDPRISEEINTTALANFIENYSGVRIAKDGSRFLIEQATVWNVVDVALPKQVLGQAVIIKAWHAL
jgi:nucleoside-diphosphate-sugar epimerase